MNEKRQPTPPLPIRAILLGQVRIHVGDRLLGEDVWSLRSARSLLLLLLISPDHGLSKERVIDTLWPEATPDVGRNALYKALHLLRRVLDPEFSSASKSAYIDSRGGRIAISSGVDLWVDADACQAALRKATGADAECRRILLREAVDLYGGELLPTDPYEDWPVARREALRHAWEGAVLELAALDLEANEPQASVTSLEQLLAIDSTNEAAHRSLMRGYVAAGQHERALRQFERCVAALQSELRVAPDATTQELHAAIVATTASQDSQSHAKAGPFNNLPSPPTEIVGRDREVEMLTGTLWRQDVRLMTLTGPGGVGKSRLAIEVASRLVDDFADGVAFVPLAAVRDPGLVLYAIANTFDLSEETNVSLDGTLTAYLRDREMLLVLDNFEQVLDAATEIGELLSRCATLTILVTSRERLQLRGEHVHEVPTLTVPRRDRLPSPTVLARYGSVVLFSQHMQRVDPDFRVGPDNSEAVSAICSHLEGLPLAIELATARARFYSLDSLLARLTRRLDIEQGQRDLPARQRTLRATFEWSHDLLSPEEQAVFRRLGPFVGGCALEAAEAVCGVEDLRVEDHLHSLAEKHLLRWERTDDGPRITMLESIREFAMELLEQYGETHDVMQRHARYFLDLAIQAEEHLGGSELLTWLERLDVEQGNIRVALNFSIDRQDDPGLLAVQGIVALWSFWLRRGFILEGIDWLERALDRPGTAPQLRTQALLSLAHLREAQGDYPRAEALIDEALSISQKIGDRAGVARALDGLGEISENRGDLKRAVALHRQALSLYQEAGYRKESTRSLSNIATVAYYQGDFTSARTLWDEALAIVREFKDEWAISVLLGNLGAAAMANEDFDKAVALHEENLSIARRLKDPATIGRSLCNLAEAKQFRGDGDHDALLDEALALNREAQDKQCEISTLAFQANSAVGSGDCRRAAQLYSESLGLCLSLGDRVAMANTALLERICEVAICSGQFKQGAQLLGSSETLRSEVGAPIMPYLRPLRDRCLGHINERMTADERDSAMETGRHREPDAAIQDALAVCTFAHTVSGETAQAALGLALNPLLRESDA